jgi:hypothetical protein
MGTPFFRISMSIEDLAAQQRRETTERAKRHAKRQDDAVFLRTSGSALIGGDTVSVSSSSNGPFVPGQAAAFLGPGVVDVPSRVGVSPVAIPSVVSGIDCIISGVLVYQYIVTYFRPSSSYAAFDSELHATERIIWFTNDGNQTILYERISAPDSPNGFPDIRAVNKNLFWSNSDGTGQVCFRYKLAKNGPEFDEIWNLTPTGATRLSSQQSPSTSQYKGGSLGVGNTSINPEYLLSESPRTITERDSNNLQSLVLSGVKYPMYDRSSTGSRTNANVRPFPTYFASYLPTMAKNNPISYGLQFHVQFGGGVYARDACLVINGFIVALVDDKTYSLQSDGSYESPPLNPLTTRLPSLNIGALGNLAQPGSLPTPPFAPNEHFWIGSGVLASNLTPSEGIGSKVWVLGSYLNASANCLIRSSADLVGVLLGTPYVLDDPNTPI